MPICRVCEKELPRKSFSNAQLKKPSEARRCKECVQGCSDAPDAVELPAGGVNHARTAIPPERIPHARALFLDDETMYVGGRARPIGSARFPLGRAPSIDEPVSLNTKRLSNSIAAIKRAFDTVKLEEKTALDEAAIQVEPTSKAQVSTGFITTTQTINESVLMSTQRWFISTLPMETIRQCIEVALLYRNIVRNFDEPLIAKLSLIPNSAEVFPTHLPSATEQNRPDIIHLLNYLFIAPDCTNVWVFSELDEEICCAWHGMDQEDTILLGRSKEDILAFIQGPDTLLELQTCYWCERNSLSCQKLSLCTKCRKVTYCSKQCQLYDWKSFHKVECTHDERIGISRVDCFRKAGVKAYCMDIAAPDYFESIWRGDSLTLGVLNATPDCQTGNKSKGFPRGFCVEPREHRRRKYKQPYCSV